MWTYISTVTISISFTLLKLAGLLFHSYYCTTAHAHTRACTYAQKQEHVLHIHTRPTSFTSSSTWEVDILKKACTLKSFYSIRSFTALFMLCCSFFFFRHGQRSWKSANESLMDRMEQSKRGAWPPCPSLLPLPGLFEQSVRIRTDSQALMEATHFEGARIFDAEPVNNASFLWLGKNWPAGFLREGKM